MSKSTAIILIICIIFSLTGCGVSQDDYDLVIKENEQYQSKLNDVEAEKSSLQDQLSAAEEQITEIQADKNALQADYDSLEKEYAQLKADTADWVKLSDEEKAAEQARAEAERIEAEEAAKKAKEEQEAAEKAAEEEAAKEAEEERAAREAELKKGYETGITYDNLARNPDTYKWKKVKFKGEVLQVIEDSNITEIRLATKSSPWGGYMEDVVYLSISNSMLDSRILEGDIITIYGISQGLFTYETVMGSNMTIPLIYVDKVEY